MSFKFYCCSVDDDYMGNLMRIKKQSDENKGLNFIF